MDRKELLDALEELEGRLDIAPIEDEEYTSLRDALTNLKDKLCRRVL